MSGEVTDIVPKEALVSGTVTDIVRVVEGIRRRARSSRRSALALIAVLTVIGVGTAYIFLILTAGGPLITVGGSASQSTFTVTTGSLEWINELTRSFIRIASVIMAVFIINILVSFARYNLRAANFLDSRADCLVISLGDIDKFAALLPSISVDPLDFGATPMTPYDTYLAAIRGIIPGRFQSVEEGQAHKPKGEK
jgi:hypothetical protein